jgi:hypothetical protein
VINQNEIALAGLEICLTFKNKRLKSYFNAVVISQILVKSDVFRM